MGVTFSYCNSGFVILGRIIEQLTGMVWDAALAEQLVAPLGLTHTWTLPEDVLRFRAAMGHVTGAAGQGPQPAASWYEMRSIGPAGLVCATAADVVAFARLHLEDGCATDGTRVLAAASATEMQRPQVAVPNPHAMADHWGLGWALSDWGGRRVFGHDGDSIGQSAFLRVVPDAGVAVALLTNSDRTGAFYREVYTELLAGLCDLAPPVPLDPPANRPRVDLLPPPRRGVRAGRDARGGGLARQQAAVACHTDRCAGGAVAGIPHGADPADRHPDGRQATDGDTLDVLCVLQVA